MDGQAHFAEQLAIQREIEDALEEASRRPLTDDEIALLSWASGVQPRKETNHAVER